MKMDVESDKRVYLEPNAWAMHKLETEKET